MNSREYWAKREAEQLKHNITEEAEYSKEIQKIYSNMLDACNKEINAFYGKYADKEGITLAEAKKRVSALDIKEYERKAQRYVRDATLDRKVNGGKTNKSGYYFSEKANEEMRLYNLTMKVNRLEMLKANIGIELIKGHDELDKFMGGILKGRTMAELERQAGILGKTVRNNAKAAHAIVNGSFHSGTFSDRIWQYQDIMREDLGKLLQTALIRGKNPRAIAGDLKKYWYGNDPKTGGGARYCMERLMRTELARVQTEAQKQSFERNGFEEYKFIANGDCCGICKALDGKVFKVAKMMPGENASPMHPHCRCSTAAHSDRAEYDAWLDFLEKGGTTVQWNALSKEVKSRLIKRQKQLKEANEKPFDITDNGKFTQLSITDKDEFAKYIEHEFTTQKMTVKELHQMWDKAVGYIQNSQGYQDINGFLRGLKTKLDDPKRKITINIMERITKNNSLKKDYIGVRKVDSGYLENVLGLDISGLFKTSLQKNAFGRKQPVQIPKDKAAAETIAKQIKQLVKSNKAAIPDKAFTSVSLSENLNYFTHFPIKFEIQMPAGTKGVITNNLPESEFITKKDSTIDILDAEVYNDGEKYCVKILARLLQ